MGAIEKDKTLGALHTVDNLPVHTYLYESLVMTERVRSQTQASEMRFLPKIKELRCLTNFVTLRFENLLTSSRYFSGSKNLSLGDLTMLTKFLRNGFPKKLELLKLMRIGQLDDHEQDGLVMLRILISTVWDSVQVKCSLRWWNEKCGGLI